MISLLKVESQLHGIKFSPHKEISEHSYSLWLLRERIPTVILNVNVPCKLEDYLKQKTFESGSAVGAGGKSSIQLISDV